MGTNKKMTLFIIDYILPPLNLSVMFWILFFDSNTFSFTQIVNHLYDYKLYLALLFAILFQVILYSFLRLTENKYNNPITKIMGLL
jgi:hypothetical protein